MGDAVSQSQCSLAFDPMHRCVTCTRHKSMRLQANFGSHIVRSPSSTQRRPYLRLGNDILVRVSGWANRCRARRAVVQMWFILQLTSRLQRRATRSHVERRSDIVASDVVNIELKPDTGKGNHEQLQGTDFPSGSTFIISPV